MESNFFKGAAIATGISLVMWAAIIGLLALIVNVGQDRIADHRAASCAVTWEGARTEGAAIARIADYCGIDRDRAADVFYRATAPRPVIGIKVFEDGSWRGTDGSTGCLPHRECGEPYGGVGY